MKRYWVVIAFVGALVGGCLLANKAQSGAIVRGERGAYYLVQYGGRYYLVAAKRP